MPISCTIRSILYPRGIPIMALLLLAAGSLPAEAFDCAKAATAIDQAICGDDEAMRANTAMEEAYFSLHERLDREGRAILLAGQKQWLAWRDENCGTEASCLTEKSGNRATALEGAPAGMTPFFQWQKGDRVHYDVTLDGYRFTTRAYAGDASYMTWLDKTLAETPFGDEMADEVETTYLWTHEVSIEVTRLTSRLMSAIAWTYDYSGGAHSNVWTSAVNIDRNSGQILDAAAVFGANGLDQLVEDCKQQIAVDRADSSSNGSVEDALNELEMTYPGVVAGHAADMSRWHFTSEGGTIQFDPYAIGPYSAGPFECEFDKGKIRSLALDPDLFIARE